VSLAMPPTLVLFVAMTALEPSASALVPLQQTAKHTHAPPVSFAARLSRAAPQLVFLRSALDSKTRQLVTSTTTQRVEAALEPRTTTSFAFQPVKKHSVLLVKPLTIAPLVSFASTANAKLCVRAMQVVQQQMSVASVIPIQIS